MTLPFRLLPALRYPWWRRAKASKPKPPRRGGRWVVSREAAAGLGLAGNVVFVVERRGA